MSERFGSDIRERSQEFEQLLGVYGSEYSLARAYLGGELPCGEERVIEEQIAHCVPFGTEAFMDPFRVVLAAVSQVMTQGKT